MTPPPTLQELIDSVVSDAPGHEPLEELATAAATVATLDETTDALLSHFVDRARRNGHSWSDISAALGVSKQAAHKRFSPPAPALERFTPRARRVLEHAEVTARALGHPAIESEHLLLGLFEEPEGIAARVLTELGASRATVERELLARVQRGAAIGHQVPLSARAAGVVGAAVGQALELGHNYVGTEHLALAVYSDSEGIGAQILTQLGVERAQVRAKVVEILSKLAP
jgi:hypothetical protein